MKDARNPFNYPQNPDFGEGVYRRAIRLEQHDGYVSGDLEDSNHGFQVQLYHDGKQVTAVKGQARRVPFTTCPEAIDPLQALVGMPLGLSAYELSKRVNPRANCTHWLDLALLALVHAARVNEPVREYSVAVPDEDDKPTTVTVQRNGEEVLQWQVQEWVVQKPAYLAANTLFKGFSRWASDLLADEDEKEAAFVLQKGYFVSRARRFHINSMAGESANAHATMFDACFTYSEPRRSIAKRTLDTAYDFTDTPEQLLQFIDRSSKAH